MREVLGVKAVIRQGDERCGNVKWYLSEAVCENNCS